MRWNWKGLVTSGQGMAAIAVAVVCLNIIGSQLTWRWDVTQDKVYTLSPGTKNIIGKLAQDVVIKFYFSRSLKELPVFIKTYATRVEEVLREYEGLSGGKIALEVFDPKPDTDEEEWAGKYGVQAGKLPNGGEMFFGAVVLSGSKEIPLPYFDPRREEFLEYDISEALVRSQLSVKPKVGILSSLPIFGAPTNPMTGEGGEAWMFVQQLQKMFEVEEVGADVKTIPDGLDLLVVFHPKQPSDGLQYALDQFVMRGGRLIVAVDPMNRADMSQGAAMAQMSGRMPEANSDLPKLFAAWGVEYDKSTLVGDMRNMMRVNAGGVVTSYPFYFGVPEVQLARDSVITGQLRSMLITEGGAFRLKEGAALKLEALISTSEDSGTASATMAAFMGPADLARETKAEKGARTVAGILRGNFPSAFPEGVPEGVDGVDAGTHRKAAQGDGVVVVIADSDFLADHNAVDIMRFGRQVIARPRNDNLNFLVNSVEFLGGSQDLIAIRSSGRIARPFSKVQELEKEAQEKWKQEEEVLSQKISELQKKLNELQEARASGSAMTLNAEQQQEISRFKEEEREARRRRREVRKNLREDIEALGTQLAAVNLLLVPAGVGAFGVVTFVRRGRRRKEGAHRE